MITVTIMYTEFVGGEEMRNESYNSLESAVRRAYEVVRHLPVTFFANKEGFLLREIDSGKPYVIVTY